MAMAPTLHSEPITIKIFRGVAEHFRQRALSWFSSTALAFAGMTEPGWLGFLALIISSIRLSSLVINGNFPKFPIASYLRVFSVIASALMWVQLAFTFDSRGDHLFGIGMCILLIAADIINTTYATIDL